MEQVFIYLIITVILILVSVRKGKKNQQSRLEQLKKLKQQQPQEQKQQSDPLSQIFRQIGGDFFEEPQSPEFEEEASIMFSPDDPEPFLNVDLQKGLSVEQLKRKTPRKFTDRKDRTEEEIIQEQTDLPELSFPDLITIEDWRKAIIYSEIIHRKYN